MNVLIVTFGSRGDVQPFVALGVGLQRAGHRVTVCTSRSFADLVAENGLDFAGMDVDIIEMANDPAARKAIEGGGNPLGLIRKVQGAMRGMLEDEWTAVRITSPDLILYHPKSLGGYHLGEKLGIPAILSMPLPAYTPTKAFANPILPFADLGGWLNRLSYKIVPLISAPYMGTVNDWRQKTLGLPPVSRLFSEIRATDNRMPTLYPYSAHLIPRPADWPQTTQAPGYWFLDQQTAWQPPADLLTFLAAGPPPVYVGFGSMSGTRPQQLARITVEALRQTGQRGVVATGWGGLEIDDVPETIFKLKEAPHDWLFPRMTAVVHHGGAGTTATGLRAGKPTMICPFFGDQPFWGRHVHAMGVGPAPIKQKRLTVAGLAAAIDQMVNDEAMRGKAAVLGEEIRAEDGIANALTFIEQLTPQYKMT